MCVDTLCAASEGCCGLCGHELCVVCMSSIILWCGSTTQYLYKYISHINCGGE